MAPNKKIRLDYSTALKAQADKMAPKQEQRRDKSKETFEAFVNGTKVTIVRGDSTDVEWENAKQTVTDKATVSEEQRKAQEYYEETGSTKKLEALKGKPTPEQRRADEEAKKPPKYEGKPTDLEYERPVKEDRGESGAEGGGGSTPMAKMAGMVKDAATGATEGEGRSFVDMSPEEISKYKQSEARSRGSKMDDFSESHYRGVIEKAKAEGRDPGQAVNDLIDAQNYTSEKKVSESKAVGNAVAGIPGALAREAVAPGLAPLKAVDERVFGDKPLTEGLPNVNDFAGHVAGQVGTGAQMLGGALGMPNLQKAGQGLIQSGESAMLNAEQPVVDPSAPMPMQEVPPPQSQDLSGSGSSSMSMQVPGGFAPAKLDPQLEKDLAASRVITANAIENAKEVIGTQEVLKDAAVRAEGNRRLEVQKQMEVEAGLAADAKRRSVEEARRYSTARQQTLQLAREAAATPTDPNRYWNNKDAGQKAAAVIAGALFGFTGQGMNWLQRLDGLVEQDMRAQQADRASKVGALNAEASGLGEAGAEALRNGATESEAYLIARQAKLEGLNSYLQQMTAETQNMDQKMRGAQMQVELSGRLNALDQEAMQLGQQKVNAENQVRFHNAQLRQESFSIGAKALAGPNRDKLPPAQQGVIQAADAGLHALPALEEAIGNPEGKWSTAMWDQVVKHVPGSDPSNRAASAAVLNRIIFAGIDKSVINAADQKFLDSLQADVGMGSLRKPGALKTLRRLLTESRNSALRTAQGLGQDTGSLQETTGPAKLRTERAF